MAKQTINTGTIANDGTGDTLRTAGTKINANFTELYNIVAGGGAGVSQLTDSGLDIIGVSSRTKLGATDPGSNDILINFPDSSGNVVIDTATQTLTNKTIDSADINHPLVHDLRLRDLDEDAIFTIIPAHITSDTNIRIPALADSDTLVFNNQTATLTNKTLTTPTIKRPNVQEWLADSLGEPVVSFTATGSTRNRIRVQSVTSGSAPVISTLGSSDTNINLNINAKGSGSVQLSKPAYSSATYANGTTVSSSVGTVVLTGGATGTVIMPDGTTQGEQVNVLRRSGTGQVLLSMTTFAQGSTGIYFDANDTATLVWDGTTGWNVTGGYGYAIDSANGAPFFGTV